MSRIFFILLLIIANIIRGPLSVVVIVLKNFIRPLHRRIEFERKNLTEATSRSFKWDLKIADYCFEVSSEGELEQVRPLIEFFLSKNNKIEIIFASPSVESKCLKLARDNPENIRVLRLPIASFFPLSFFYFQSPWQWITAPKILFCRYDFYPELLSLKWFGKKFILLSAASKKPTWFKNEAFKFFDIIVAANLSEEAYFKKAYGHIEKQVFTFDFRMPRIFSRINQAETTLKNVPHIQNYLDLLKQKPLCERIIIGSAWPSDLAIFNDPKWIEDLSSGKTHLLIVPHDLKAESINNLYQDLKRKLPGISVRELSSNTPVTAFDTTSSPEIVLLNTSGILCEIYTYFSFAYVGGGYERSIHSVLEPFLAGAEVLCGPKVMRSTEFDFIKDLVPDEIHLLKNPESFYNEFQRHKLKLLSLETRQRLKDNSLDQMDSIIKEIQSC